jgi:anti-sigma factor RsiW
MTPIDRHDSTWQDRLLDLLDGDLYGAERSTVEAHLSRCARCRAQYAELKRLDTQLKRRIGTMTASLDMSFERQVLARIEALDTRSRVRARREADREFNANLQALSRHRRHALASIIGGAIAGIASALALASWVDIAAWSGELLEKTSGLATAERDVINLLATAAVGAVIGGGISRWLAGTLD